jgi:hypothetical protein
MVKTGGGGGGSGERSHAICPPMQIIHCTSEKRKAHGKDLVVVVVVFRRSMRFLHRCRLHTARRRGARLMVETGCGGGGETSHAFSPTMQIIHCTSEKRKAHGRDWW